MSHFLKKWMKHNIKNDNYDQGEDSSDNPNSTSKKMISFFAHEIRNPLATIIGFSKYLEQEPSIKSDPSISNYVGIIKSEASKMDSLIEELLNLSKSDLNYENLTIIDVKHSIEKILSLYDIDHGNKSIIFQTDLIDDIYITGNIEQFEKLIVNLLSNAIDAIDQNGIIKIIMNKIADSLILFIIDNGNGILAEHLEHIYTPFFTTKEDRAGIGLSICKTIIETFNGTLMVQSDPASGTHVTIKIPLSKDPIFNR